MNSLTEDNCYELPDKAGGTNILLVRLVAIAFAVLNMVILKITCQTCMLSQNLGQAMA